MIHTYESWIIPESLYVKATSYPACGPWIPFHIGESVPGEIAPVFFASIAVVAHGAMCDKQQRVGLRQAKIPFVQIFESSSSAIS